MIWTIDALLTGRAVPFGVDGEPSAIGKTPVDRPLRVGPMGIEGDEQADLVHHGGVDKAIHHYPRDHYAFWRARLGPDSLLNGPGAFGENITTTGLVEAGLCIGDRLRLGTALVEVSQARQPCWKLGRRFGIESVPATVVKTAYSGWYYRVIENGLVAAGDRLEMVDRPLPQWPVDLVFRLLIGGTAKREPALARALAALPQLSVTWRKRAAAFSG
ncbi:MOSC domain-containing protein [Sphingomonas sp. SCN 67-18]|uniref:MOSC domain-containing protein n=1 Tax=uncultured Sphingomonas sp. TaxID=158754 RepID=UPI000AE926B8|nr:MOSC domain-containing protein [Sphingomonas sp. SCN 67-18]